MVRGLDIGADDYIKKPFSIIEFITRVKAVLRRTLEQPDDKYMTIGDIFLDNERHVVYVDNKGIELTYKEYELLKTSYAQRWNCSYQRKNHGACVGYRI